VAADTGLPSKQVNNVTASSNANAIPAALAAADDPTLPNLGTGRMQSPRLVIPASPTGGVFFLLTKIPIVTQSPPGDYGEGAPWVPRVVSIVQPPKWVSARPASRYRSPPDRVSKPQDPILVWTPLARGWPASIAWLAERSWWAG
jgi:hypothetical protein